MSALTNKDDRQISAKLNRAYGEVARMQIDCRYFSSIYRFKVIM